MEYKGGRWVYAPVYSNARRGTGSRDWRRKFVLEKEKKRKEQGQAGIGLSLHLYSLAEGK